MCPQFTAVPRYSLPSFHASTMVSTRRTKRPSFGDETAASLAPTTPATRGKRTRASSATSKLASATPARARQQRRGRSKAQDTAETKEAEGEEVVADGRQSELEPADVVVVQHTVQQTVTVSLMQSSTVEEQQEQRGAEEAADASSKLETDQAASSELVDEADQQTAEDAIAETGAGDVAGGDNVDEAGDDEDARKDDDDIDEAYQPRVRPASTEDAAEEGRGNERYAEDVYDEDEDDGVEEDDEYNFDVDNEPLAPPTASPLDDEDDDDNLRAKETRRQSARTADDDDEDDGTTGASTKFGATLSALLQQPTASLASPLLAAAPLLPIPRDPTAAADRALRLKQRARREWRERAHRTEVQYDEVERRLVRVATRGVVQLFNAVQQQRRTLRQQAAIEEKDRADLAGSTKQAAEMSKEGFMQLIRTAPSVERPEEQRSSVRAEGGPKAANGERAGGWSVLKDDYMLGGKLTDWDKQVDDSDEDEEVEEQQEMEVE